MSVELPGEDLLARVARGDQAALGELYDRYAPRIYGLIVHILPSREAAEDILQAVFARLWHESPHLRREGGSVAAWLVVSAREAAVARLRSLRMHPPDDGHQGHGHGGETGNPESRKTKSATSPPAARSARRKAETVRQVAGEAARTLPAAWLPQAKEIALIDDRLALLHKAINQLPPPQREALELAVFAGLSESEIAAALGEPLGKVRTSLRAAVTFVKHRRRAVCGTWAANI